MATDYPLTCVDLFSGCGGLSLGLKQAGFKLKLAVEKSPMAAETYYHNFIQPLEDRKQWKNFHEDLAIEDQAEAGLVVRELADVLASPDILSSLREADIDLVAGGPPCQGFSLAGRRNPKDVRNKLPWQFLDLVEKICPKAVIIENVSGIRQDFRKHGSASPFDELRIALSRTGPGYAVQPMHLNAMHFGAPQHRPRVFLVAIRADLAEENSINITEDTWDSALDAPQVKLLGMRPSLAPVRTHFSGEDAASQYVTVKDAISDLLDHGYDAADSASNFAKEMRSDSRFLVNRPPLELGLQRPSNHVLRSHSERVKERFGLYQFFRDAEIHPKVLAHSRNEALSSYARRKLMLEAISSVEYPVRSGDGGVLAKDQQALMRLLKKLATKKHSQRALSWHRPAPTVVSLPDDYVHPSRPRIPTVRELARFQSFPDAFEFRSKETTGSDRRRFEVPQYTQVGNAVPPLLARALGENLAKVLSQSSSAAKEEAMATATA
jgi:DNA (cytosine-5)-methyltransferase 1